MTGSSADGTLAVTPLGPSIGAEVSGVDLAGPLDALEDEPGEVVAGLHQRHAGKRDESPWTRAPLARGVRTAARL